jgi:ElaB/YqjD/DUF883 family membrane-anchored ribosome-binding protein
MKPTREPDLEGKNAPLDEKNPRDQQGFKEITAELGRKTPPAVEPGDDSGEWTRRGGADPTQQVRTERDSIIWSLADPKEEAMDSGIDNRGSDGSGAAATAGSRVKSPSDSRPDRKAKQRKSSPDNVVDVDVYSRLLELRDKTEGLVVAFPWQSVALALVCGLGIGFLLQRD